jgi:hypothetical protein
MTDTGYLYEYFLAHSEQACEEKGGTAQKEGNQDQTDSDE